jgi:hypothetical protein
MNKSTKTIPFARPDIGAEEEKAVLRVFERLAHDWSRGRKH